MSSKRGRKRNDNLPPNRARDVQRAFRARRAAHLEALEHRVAELEEENGNLRAALNLPPANRAPLGKGPTGKDKPRQPGGAPSRSSQAAALDSVSRGGSSADSPTSTRAQSLSPSTITATMRPSPNAVHSLEGSSWEQGMIIGGEEQPNHHHHHATTHTSSTSTAYALSSVPHAKNPTPQQFSSYQSSAAAAAAQSSSSSRSSLPGTMYMPSVQQGTQNFTHAGDRPLGEATYGSAAGGGSGGASGGGGGGGGYTLRDPREDQQRFPPYSQPSYSGGPGPESALHYTTHQQRDPSPAQTPVPFAHRRSITDPQGFSSLVNQYPHLPPPSGLRRLSPPRLSEGSHSVRPSFNGGGS